MEGKKIKVDTPIEATFKKWLARGDSIAVFRNHDLSHPECGREVFVPSHSRDQTPNKVGDRLWDSPEWGLGWRYLCDEVTTDLSHFEFVEQVVVATTKKRRK